MPQPLQDEPSVGFGGASAWRIKVWIISQILTLAACDWSLPYRIAIRSFAQSANTRVLKVC
jgi:hypothetical protein